MKFRTVMVAVCAATAMLSACGAEPAGIEPSYDRVDCDHDDLVEHDSDCGYWDASGTYWYWYWVDPRTGGVSPYGWHPSVPSGGSTRKPYNAKPGGKPSVQPSPRPPAGTVARPAPVPRPPAGTAAKPAAPKTPTAPPKYVPPPPKYVPPPPPKYVPPPKAAPPRAGR